MTHSLIYKLKKKNKKQMSLWELRYRKNLAKSGHTGTLTVPKDLKAKYNSKSLAYLGIISIKFRIFA